MIEQSNNPFSFLNIVLFFIYAIILYSVYSSKKKQLDKSLIKYYNYNYFFKVVLVVIFAVYYYISVGGGDTVAYWDGAVCLNNLFWESPSSYFISLLSPPNSNLFWLHFGVHNTGLPPGWIYREPESWFISKVCSIISFFTFKSYLAGSVFFAFIMAKASWRLFELVNRFNLHKKKHIAFAVLLIPSVGFWCSGVTKDTVVLLCIIYINVNFLEWILKIPGNNRKRVLFILFYGFLLFHIRDFMLSVIGVAFGVVLMARLANKYRGKLFQFYSLRLITIVLGFVVFATQGNKLAESEQIKQAEVTANDFASNKTYEGARYSIGVSNFSTSGLIIGFLPSVIAGIYRPFIWEGLTPSLIFNGLESVYFFYLTWLFLSKDFFKKVNIVRKNEFLVFAFVFSILLAFMVGLTSGLLGVLVRFKAPLLSFILLVLTVNINQENDSIKVIEEK